MVCTFSELRSNVTKIASMLDIHVCKLGLLSAIADAWWMQAQGVRLLTSLTALVNKQGWQPNHAGFSSFVNQWRPCRTSVTFLKRVVAPRGTIPIPGTCHIGIGSFRSVRHLSCLLKSYGLRQINIRNWRVNCLPAQIFATRGTTKRSHSKNVFIWCYY